MDEAILSGLLEDILSEDIGSGDVTSNITPNRRVEAKIVANQKAVVSGLEETNLLLKNHNINSKTFVKDGEEIEKGNTLMSLSGMSRDILSVERTILNILSRMSAISTHTSKYVEYLNSINSETKVASTRKTTPGFRYFEKKAVKVAGGLTHRMGLYDMILVKDNHLVLFENDIGAAVSKAREKSNGMKVEVEVNSVDEALTAAEHQADIIMFDNMTPEQVRQSVEMLKKKGLRKNLKLEVSGGITLKNLKNYAVLGVDFISVGALTHSSPSIDLSLEIIP